MNNVCMYVYIVVHKNGTHFLVNLHKNRVSDPFLFTLYMNAWLHQIHYLSNNFLHLRKSGIRQMLTGPTFKVCINTKNQHDL